MNRSTGTRPLKASSDIQGESGIVEQAKETVANVTSDAKAGVTAQIEQKKEIAVEKFESVSDVLRGASEKLEGMGPLPELATKAAEGIDRIAHYFEDKTVGDVIRGVESYAKREPAVFIGGAALLGIVAGRFLKSSARHGVEGSSGPGPDPYETYGFEGSYDDDYLGEGELDGDDLQTIEEEPFAFEPQGEDPVRLRDTLRDRDTAPQGSSAGAVGVGAASRGGTEKIPATPLASDFANKSGR